MGFHVTDLLQEGRRPPQGSLAAGLLPRHPGLPLDQDLHDAGENLKHLHTQLSREIYAASSASYWVSVSSGSETVVPRVRPINEPGYFFCVFAQCLGAYMNRFLNRFFLFLGRLFCCLCFCDFWKNLSACVFLEFKDGSFPPSSKSLGVWHGKT